VVDREADVAVAGASVDTALPVEGRVNDQALEKPVERVERLLVVGWRSVEA
jgi:hypothetical protein